MPRRNFFDSLLTSVYLLYILHIYRETRGTEMNILIDNRSGTPIYEQIYTQIKNQIIGGDLR